MNAALNRRLLAVFGLIIAFVAAAGAVAAWFTWKAQHDFQALYANTLGSGELGKADSALWQLRYSLAMAAQADAVAVRKAADAEAGTFKALNDALDRYGATGRGADEAQGLAALRDAVQRYAQVRPAWFKLRLDGQDDEARAYRAKHTTPTGAALVKAIEAQIDLQNRAAAAAHTQLDAQASRVRLGVIAASLVALSVAGVLAGWIIRVLTEPVAHATALAHRIAQGHLSNHVAAGSGPLRGLLDALAQMQASLAGTVAAVRGNADQVADAGSAIAGRNHELSVRTEQQASALAQTASAMEQLGATVRLNADHAAQASQLARGASDVAAQGGAVVAQVVDTMKGIHDSARRIGDIISVIDGIAFQTNILALNAAVEAARAGEQGRGFAVVAGEVRSLAQRSAAAAREVKQLITASVERTEQGSALVDQAGATMQDVVRAIRRVTDVVAEISQASAEQSSGVAQVGDAVGQMDRTTQQNAALVQQSATAATELQDQAKQLVQAVAVFQLGATAAR
ncbi:methyl-accepting chemotaxis protein [Aquabacterium humicola]|uniref:methyl-accepting chemotaxis protein n=1 Tax=Aquabacterium humicola TaxID=3237377 RepID=UPI002543BF7F|nr:methyl-accepting chemotaxis protein [Rubrivivax pictus]